MFAVSTDKLKKNEPAYEIACNIWHEIIPVILPTLLELLRFVALVLDHLRTP